MIDSLSAAQADMRRGYASGAAGILASGLVWAAAAAICGAHSVQAGIWVLLGGGMLIHPLAIVLCKLLGVRGAHSPGNPLAALAGASTFWLVFCLPLAFGLSLHDPFWFFPAMLLVIGGRYLVFVTLYGMRLYWLLGFALVAAGVAAGILRLPPMLAAAAGSALEIGFALAALGVHRRLAASAG